MNEEVMLKRSVRRLEGARRPLALAATAAIIAGCVSAPRSQEPVPPTPPTPPAIEAITRPEMPEGTQQRSGDLFKNEFKLRSYPEVFPVERGDVMVIAVPAQALAKQGGVAEGEKAPSSQEASIRYAAVLGFLTSGYKVKDAGILTTSTLSMRRYPATESEKSIRVTEVSKEGEEGTKEVVETTTQGTPSRDYWWYNRGMTLNLKDPTSLWAPELMTYKSLKADYFLRIFSVDFHEKGTVAVELRYEYSPEEIEAYRAEVARANEAIEAANAKIREYNAALEAYDEQYLDYSHDHNNWTAENFAYFTARGGAPSTEPHEGVQPMEELPLASVDALEARVAQRWTEQVPVSYGRVTAEVIDANTGTVAWVGSFVAVAERETMSLETLMVEMARHLTESSR